MQVPEGPQRDACDTCYREAGADEGRVFTAVGCIRTGGRGLTEDLVRLLMGVSGGVALLSILAGAFLYTTSQGDSSKVKEAKALLTASVSGLFFIIFSIFILQFLGVTILRIPGLTGDTSSFSGSDTNCSTEAHSAGQGQPCCSGLVPSGPNSICRQPRVVVNGGYYLFDDAPLETRFCVSSEDEQYIQSARLISAQVNCRAGLHGVLRSNFSPVQASSQLGSVSHHDNGLFYRCGEAVDVSSSVYNAFAGYLSATLGLQNSSQYRLYVEERTIGAVRYYDVNVMIEPDFWETLPQDVRDELNSGPQLQLSYDGTWGWTVEGTSFSQDTSFSGYATILIQVVSFRNG